VDPFVADFWVALGVSLLCGGLIGLERQLRGKPAGIRTSTLICLGTMVFIRQGQALLVEGGDATRVLGQVVTGIGFIGAGLMMAKGGLVRGVTSAAVVWVLAGIGAMIGFGNYAGAVALALVTLFILSGVEFLEYRLTRHLRRGDHRESGDDEHE
jgi:putative Mg2+ transporter-C (MgtC) family protein